jgi:hemoglobin/transferrin/lactoferrin receptor protein
MRIRCALGDSTNRFASGLIAAVVPMQFFDPLPKLHRAWPLRAFACQNLRLPTALAVGLMCLATERTGAQTVNQVATPLAPSSANSADTRLPDVVVTANRSERNSEDVPATVEVIGPEQLERDRITNIRELVNAIPNAEVRRRSNRVSINSSDGREGNASIGIRGLDGNRVLLLIDGIRAPRNYSFGAASRDNFGIGLIERVEVVKGPSSALYGSDGLGGLVQFFTKSPQTLLKGGKAIAGQFSVVRDQEDWATHIGASLAGQASIDSQWLLSLNGTRASELQNRGVNASSNSDRTVANPQRDRETAALVKWVWRPNSVQIHTFSLEAVAKQNDIDVLSLISKPPLVATSVLSATAANQNNRNRLSWQGQWRNLGPFAERVQATLAVQQFKARERFADDRNLAADRVRDTIDTERSSQAQLQAETSIQGNNLVHKLVYGLDLTLLVADHLQTGIAPPVGETFPLKRFPKTLERGQGLFLQNEMVSERWSLIGAVRADRYSISPDPSGFVGTPASLAGSSITPKVGGTFLLNDQTTLYGQIASGYKAPTADQVNRFFENATSFYKTIPNPKLKPERAKSIELGMKGSWQAIGIKLAVFANSYTDFINNNQVVGGTGAPGNPTVFQAVNVQRASIKGAEVQGSWQITSDWLVRVGYGHTKGRNDDTTQPLNAINPAKATVGLSHKTNWGDLRLDVVHQAGKAASDVDYSASGLAANQFLPKSVTTIDLSAQWRINSSVRASLGVRNLGNKTHWRWGDIQNLAANAAFLDSYSQPGRSFSASVATYF